MKNQAFDLKLKIENKNPSDSRNNNENDIIFNNQKVAC